MAKGLNLKAVLSLEHRAFTKGLNNIKNQLRGFSNMLKSAFALGSITMFGKQMIQVGADFENAMARVQAVSNATTKEFQAMQKEAQRLGATTRYTATEAANALENLTRNGLSASDATKALSGVLQLAQANAIELANAADILTNTMNAFGLSVTEVQRVNDVMSSTASHAATNINELYEAMTVAGPYAKIMGGSIEEAAAAIGVLANKGIKGSTAGKALAAMYQRLSAITPKAAKELQKYGLNIDEAVVKSQSLDKTLKQLADSGIGKSVEALTNLFGKNYAGDIAQLINSTDELDDMLTTLANSAGTTERMFNQGIGSVQKELDTLKSMYEDLLITISQKTDGVVKGAIRLLQNLILNFKSVGGTLMNIGSVIVPLVAKNVVALGRTIKAVAIETSSAVATAKALIGGLLPLIITLVTWVGTALVGAWNRAHRAMKDAKKEMKNAENEISQTTAKANTLIKKLGRANDKNSLNGVVAEAIQLFPDFADAINNAADVARRTGRWDVLKSVLEDIVRLQNSIVKKDANEKVIKAAQTTVGHEMWKESGKERLMQVTEYANGKGFFTREIPNLAYIVRKFSKIEDKDYVKNALNDIAGYFLSGKSEKEIAKDVGDYLEAILDDKAFAKYNGEQLAESVIYSIRHYTSSKAGEAGKKASEELDSVGDTQALELIEAQRKSFNADIENAKQQKEERKISQKQYENQTKKAAQTFVNVIQGQLAAFSDEDTRNKFTKEVEELTKVYNLAKNEDNNGRVGGSDTDLGDTEKTPLEKIKKELSDFKEESNKLHNQLTAGTITQKEYAEEMESLTEKTIKAITAFGNLNEILGQLGDELGGTYQDLSNAFNESKEKKLNQANMERAVQESELKKKLANFKIKEKSERSTLFDFEKDKLQIQEEKVELQFDYADSLEQLREALANLISSGELNGFPQLKMQALGALGYITAQANIATQEANKMNEALAGAKAVERLKELKKELENTMIDSVETAASAFERLYNTIKDIAEVFGEEVEWKGMDKVVKLINAGVTIFETFKSVIDTVKTAQELYQQVHSQGAQKAVAENAEVAVSEAAKGSAEAGSAIAGGASSVANIPYVGAILAVMAAASIAAALFTNMNKFEKGGIITGDSYKGDHQVIRANAGELVLTRHQQATLFNAIASGNIGGGVSNVQFRIKGSDLISVMDNERNKRRG